MKGMWPSCGQRVRGYCMGLFGNFTYNMKMVHICKWFIYESSSYANNTCETHSIVFHFTHLHMWIWVHPTVHVFLRFSQSWKNSWWIKWWDSTHQQFFGILRRINKLDREKQAHKSLKTRSNGVAFFTNFSLSMTDQCMKFESPSHFTPYEETE